MKFLLTVSLLLLMAACTGRESSDTRVVKSYIAQRDSCIAAGSDAQKCGYAAYNACVIDPHWKGDISLASAKCEFVGPLPSVSPS